MGFNGIGHFADLFGPSTATAVEQLFQQQQPAQQLQMHQQQQQQMYECCVPTGDCVMRSVPVRPDDPRAPELYARVLCSAAGDGCTAGSYMHRECFDGWERLVLAYMKNAAAAAAAANFGNAVNNNNGRRVKDLWSVNVNNNNVPNTANKGYEMAFKACGCRCGRGYLKKDSEWPSAAAQPVRRQSSGSGPEEDLLLLHRSSSMAKKKKRRQPKQQQQQQIHHQNVSLHHQQQPQQQHHHHLHQLTDAISGELRLRASSMSSSSNGSSSPVTGASSNSTSSVSPVHSGSSFASSSGSKRRGVKDVFERSVRNLSNFFFFFRSLIRFSIDFPKNNMNTASSELSVCR